MLFWMRHDSKGMFNSSEVARLSLTSYNYSMCVGREQGLHIWVFSTAMCWALGFPAAVAILWELFRTHRRGAPLTPNDFFMLNLTAMDVLFLSYIPLGLMNRFILQNIWLYLTWNAFYALNTCGRPLLMACTCLDSYLAVVHPLIYRERRSLAPRAVMVGLVWTLTLLSGILYFLFNELYFTIFPSVFFILTIVVIGVCDSLILHTLVTSDLGRKKIHPQKQRAINTLVNSLVLASISYLPPAVLFAVGTYAITDSIAFICTIGIPITVTSTLGSAVMPILYLNNLGKLSCLRFGRCEKS